LEADPRLEWIGILLKVVKLEAEVVAYQQLQVEEDCAYTSFLSLLYLRLQRFRIVF
jgi:hypothetical protein